MVFNPEKITISNTPKDQDKTIESQQNRDKRMTRRGFIGGALTVGAVEAASRIEKKGTKLKKAFAFMRTAFNREEDTQEQEQLIATENKEPENPKTEIELKTNADHYLKAYLELEDKPGFFPKNLFTSDFLIAQQLQESDFKRNAESHAGAIGVMQITPICVQDDSLLLEELHDDGIIKDYEGPIYIGHLKNEKRMLENPRKKVRMSAEERQARINQLAKIIAHKKEKYEKRILKDADIDGALLLSRKNPDYSKAYGKLYHMKLFHEKYGYGAGQKEYKKGDIKGAQMEILGAYNAGYSRVKNKPIDKWLEEPRTYVKRIFNYMNRLENVRDAMAEAGLDRDNDSIAMRTAREMNKVRTRGHQRTEILDKTMNFIIDALKKEQQVKGRDLKDPEIIQIFSKLADTKDITNELFYTQNA